MRHLLRAVRGALQPVGWLAFGSGSNAPRLPRESRSGVGIDGMLVCGGEAGPLYLRLVERSKRMRAD